ncbi:MAG: hypothetical protein ACNA7E_06890 [Wenzhouxiangellaceae bacterium]
MRDPGQHTSSAKKPSRIRALLDRRDARFDIASTALVGHVIVLAFLLTTLLQVVVAQRWLLVSSILLCYTLFAGVMLGVQMRWQRHGVADSPGLRTAAVASAIAAAAVSPVSTAGFAMLFQPAALSAFASPRQRWWLIGSATAAVLAFHHFGASWFGLDLTSDFYTNAILVAGAIGLGNSMVGSIARAPGLEVDAPRSTLH